MLAIIIGYYFLTTNDQIGHSHKYKNQRIELVGSIYLLVRLVFCLLPRWSRLFRHFPVFRRACLVLVVDASPVRLGIFQKNSNFTKFLFSEETKKLTINRTLVIIVLFYRLFCGSVYLFYHTPKILLSGRLKYFYFYCV